MPADAAIIFILPIAAISTLFVDYFTPLTPIFISLPIEPQPRHITISPCHDIVSAIATVCRAIMAAPFVYDIFALRHYADY